MKIKRKHLFPFIWFSFIVYASLTPSQDLPKFNLFPHFDKIVHFVIYFVLSILLVPFLLKKDNYLKYYLISGITSILTGILFELLQFYIGQGRSASPYDAIANTIGAIIGIFFYQFFIRKKWIERVVFKNE